MFEKYLITGATGFLGRAVLAQLRDSQAEIRALVMDGDRVVSSADKANAIKQMTLRFRDGCVEVERRK